MPEFTTPSLRRRMSSMLYESMLLFGVLFMSGWLFSTLLQPDDMDKIGMRWWYIGPRNGHISLHSKKSLKLLWERYGCVVESVDEDVHMASRSAVSERLQLGGTADSAA